MSLRKRILSNVALVGLLAAALALAACGRKGGLDLPPASSADAAQATGASDETAQAAGTAVAAEPGATKRPRKPLPIDVLLN